jgi:hypothetical protein
MSLSRGAGLSTKPHDASNWDSVITALARLRYPYLWNTTSDTGLDIPEGTVVKIKEVRGWYANVAGLNMILARVAPTGSLLENVSRGDHQRRE